MGLLDNGIPLWGDHCLLVTTNSFNRVKNDDGTVKGPTKTSTITSMLFYIGIISLCQKGTFLLLSSLKWYHPIFENETNCKILARNFGMCLLSTGTMTYYGYQHRAIYSELTQRFFGSKSTMNPAGFDRRLLSYHPGGQQCAMLFCAYQLKNTFESLQHTEAAINRLHHIVSTTIAWLCLHPGGLHFYVAASSVTEVPAMMSSIYINFDDGFLLGSVPGLGILFPKTKVLFSILSGVSFLAFRIGFWFFVAYNYFLDVRRALNSQKSSVQIFKKWMPVFLICVIILFYINVALLTTVIRMGVIFLKKNLGERM